MKKIFNLRNSIALLALVAVGFTACKKSETGSITDFGTQLGAVAIASTNTVAGLQTTTSTTDSLYAMDACHKDHKRTSVKAESLPTSINTYLTTNYAGYTFIKAFSTTTISTNTLDAYVVGINFNGKPVALKFDASGNFLKVLELREGRDMKKGGDHHDGGCFDNRDGKQRDTIAISALPANIIAYFKTNYAQDTLKGAFTNKDGSIIVISKNVSFFATAFKADGTFIKRDVLPNHPGKDKEIAQSALPASVTTYLSTTYPNYVFKKAFSDVDNGVVKGYLVIIDANMTKYAVVFNASGAFISAKALR
ncbi:MAG: PepSY-like domain-containing protein [Bacteroidetes bacterium]|nr:PepSY-like domain-containing protein [Bacteroidota bacterium]MBU1373055.1 PepSY-like domain-containing protein [Bacteroidota bacterium]MBU1484236.1 PepSY-like domain-containing protein [Bacteroidota bacterium]MBU1759351.1 PepSY-like domain-containing protein [Bacteroidota bacterium]MBU2046299.1 PepSY-like domain-containing protein [Bacteroidota bacterium]